MSRFKSDHSQTGSELAGSYFLTADFFVYFANPEVLRILDLVRKKESTSLAVSRKLGIQAQTALDKLTAMEREGILISYIRSKNTFYRIADSRIVQALEQVLEFPERQLKRADRAAKLAHKQQSIRSSILKVESMKSGRKPI
jgi:predicted transcriptional regulator